MTAKSIVTERSTSLVSRRDLPRNRCAGFAGDSRGQEVCEDVFAALSARVDIAWAIFSAPTVCGVE